ncbi:MAG: hypothetical protein ASARMPRED_000637 [Alectoria sarmentosa]|nr:MAG: hypothetical protein ASARMPRED_000637 [Alectoria sarmentosa]
MHTALCIAALAGLAYSAPQLINLDEIALDFAAPVLVKAPVNVQVNIPAMSTAAAILPLQSSSAKKRDLQVEKRDGDCSPYPAGSGPVPTPDTPAAFQSDSDFANMANSAPTPDGYVSAFQNVGASLQASNYMGLYTLTSYDTLTCASKCDQASGCSAFNVYLERDPTLNANAVSCPNPPSTTNYKCTLWGAPVSSAEATNSGQYQDSFQVVIAGSNGYNKDAPPPAVSGYVGPQELGGAINAPTDSGSYMGYQFFPFSQSQGYDPQTCADACNAQTTYDSQHPAADGSFMSCVFFNAYVLSENAIPQGLYCSMYNETWDPSYGTNYGQYRGSDRYTVSESYSYTLSSTCDLCTNFSIFVLLLLIIYAFNAALTYIHVFNAAILYVFNAALLYGFNAAIISRHYGIRPGVLKIDLEFLTSIVGNLFVGLYLPDAIDTTHSISSPGDNSTFAYDFDQQGAVDPSTNKNPASVNQDLIVTVGQAYTLTFRTYFDACGDGFVGVMLNYAPVYTVDACDFGAGAFEDNTVDFTATASPWNLRFDFEVAETTAVVKIDNVAVVPVSSSASTLVSSSVSSSLPTLVSSSVPSSLPTLVSSSVSSSVPTASASCGSPFIQNGGFETGNASPWVVTAVGITSYGVVAGGSTNSGGGNYAFSASLILPSQGVSSVTLQQTMNTCPGTNYTVSVDFKFSKTALGDCSIKIAYPYKTTTGSVTTSSNFYTPGVWERTWNAFQAVSNADVVTIVLACTSGQSNVYEVDNVNITYYPGNAF